MERHKEFDSSNSSSENMGSIQILLTIQTYNVCINLINHGNKIFVHQNKMGEYNRQFY